MNILIEKGINDANALSLCEWSNDKGKDFQEQWMGNKVSYPLDCDKIRKLENVFSIFSDVLRAFFYTNRRKGVKMIFK